MKLHLLSSITVLPPPHDTASEPEAIDEWARGLDWVKWLLGSVRARTETLTVEWEGESFEVAWERFSSGLIQEILGPTLKSAWEAAQAGDLVRLMAVDAALSHCLSNDLASRSQRAGAVLLKSTRHARYQGVLGRLRESVARGESPGHLAVIWAAVGHFFQLSLTNVVAEYLRLEWDIAVREVSHLPQPEAGRFSIAELTRQVLCHTGLEQSLRVVDA